MKKFETVVSRAIVIPREDVDTDQIIPARFLRTTERAGFGRSLFADWRYDADGRPRSGFALNEPGAGDKRILIAGKNFGCGSSREHAVWALLDFGVSVIIAPSFADIFRKNALGNGLLPVAVEDAVYAGCLSAAEAGAEFTVDLQTQTIQASEGLSFQFEIDPFARDCMLEGVDELEYILQRRDAIDAYEASRT